MQPAVPNRTRTQHARSSMLTLLVTFVLGIGIGASLCYGVLEAFRVDLTGGDTVGGSNEVPVLVPPEALPDPAVFDQADHAAADIHGIWPARFFVVGIRGQYLDEETRRWLQIYKPGYVFLRNENFADEFQTLDLIADIKSAVGLGQDISDPPLIAVAQEGGERFNPLGLLHPATAAELGKMNHPPAIAETARRFAAAAKSKGVAILFAPVLDVYVPGQSVPALRERCFGTDANQVAEYGLEFAQTLESEHIVPVMKHYPGLGAAIVNNEGSYTIFEEDFQVLAQTVFLPFARAVGRQAPGILATHVAVPALDPESPERPAALSPKLVEAMLRKQLGYKGVVLADDITTGPVSGRYRLEESVVRAFAAGCDAVLMTEVNSENLRDLCNAVHAALRIGTLTAEQLKRSKERLDRWQIIVAGKASPAAGPSAVPPAPETTAPPTQQPPAASDGEPEPTETVVTETPGQDMPEDESAPSDVDAPSETAITSPDADAPPNETKTAPPDVDAPSETAITSPDADVPPNETKTAPSDGDPRPNQPEASPSEADTTQPSSDDAAPEDTDGPDKEGTPPPDEPPLETYVVQPGDGLQGIAQKFRTSVTEIIRVNKLSDPNMIRVGQKLSIPKS